MIAGVLLLVACSETKYVPEGQYLLNRVKVTSDTQTRDINTTEMKQLVKQRGNTRWFSAVKIPLGTYSLSGRDMTRWLNRTLRSIGEPPIIYDSAMTQQSMKILLQQMQNKGFLQASVDARNTVRGKKLSTEYILHPGQPYFIGKMDYDIQDSAVASLLQMDKEENRGLHTGMMFNVENLDAERKRITTMLVNQGYYHFNKDFISFLADSLTGSPNINLTLVLQRYRDNQVSNQAHPKFSIGDVRFNSGNVDDSVIHLRPSVLNRNCFIRPGELYSAADLQNTYNHFGRLGAVRFTNIAFRERPDEPVLDCDVTVSTNKPSTISFQPEGTNTAGDFGAALALTYQNRNLFRGSEALSIELRGAYEAIRGLEGYSNSDYLEYSLRTNLSFPSFIAPFLSQSFRQRINATSEVSLLFDLQNRPEFLRRVFSVGWRYKWNDASHHDHYQVDLLDLNFVSMPWISDKFYQDYLS